MANLCSSSGTPLNECDLLLHELQLRMTRAVLESDHYEQCLRSPRELYRVLADFFATQREEAQRAAALTLSGVTVRRLWTFCFDSILSLQETQTKLNEDAETMSVDTFVQQSPAIPLTALQQPAPIVPDLRPTLADSSAAPSRASTDASTPQQQQQQQQQACSLFSLLRPVLSTVMEAAYAADQQLQRRPTASSSSPALSVLALAALSASLTPTLGRVQAVRLTAQLADDTLTISTTSSSSRSRISSSTTDTVPCAATEAQQFRVMALFLGGVWRVWAALDAAHAVPLRALGDELVADALVAPRGSTNQGRAVQRPGSVFFATWLQSALRAKGGLRHQQLYASAHHEAVHVPPSEGVASTSPGGDDRDAEGCGDAQPDRDFWAQLAS